MRNSHYQKTSSCWRPIGGHRLLSALWFGWCLFVIFPISNLNFIFLFFKQSLNWDIKLKTNNSNAWPYIFFWLICNADISSYRNCFSFFASVWSLQEINYRTTMVPYWKCITNICALVTYKNCQREIILRIFTN